MSRQQTKKWFLYAAALLPLVLLEGFIFTRIDFMGSRPFLLPLAVSVVAILEGVTAGAGYGLYVGLPAALLGHGSQGSFIFLLSLLGALLGFLFRSGMEQRFLSCLIASTGALFALSLLRMGFHTIKDGASFVSMFRITAPELLWSLAFFPLVYGIYRMVSRRVAGPSFL